MGPETEVLAVGPGDLGSFFDPVYARKAFESDGITHYADAKIHPEEVFSAFHDMRVFSATDAIFKEYDRLGHGWFDVRYDVIIAAALNSMKHFT